MNMLDGLRVEYDIDDYGGTAPGIIIQTQIGIRKHEAEETFLFAVLDENGFIHIKEISDLMFYNKQLEKIFRKPKQAVRRVKEAENADTIEDRSEILDL